VCEYWASSRTTRLACWRSQQTWQHTHVCRRFACSAHRWARSLCWTRSWMQP
jgi:hypothetical protein